MRDFAHPLRMGLAPLDLADWLAPQAGDDALLAARRDIIAQHQEQVIGALPEATGAVVELCSVLHGRGRITLADGDCVARLKAIGVQLAEDICVLTSRGDQLIVGAGLVCFPNRWRLAEKLGTSILATHAPVPDYAEKVGAQVDRFLLRLAPLKAYVRSNWGVTATTELFTPAPTPPVDPLGPHGAFVRREDQSFLKLPETGAVIFSIRTSFTPIAGLGPAERAQLADSLKNFSPEWLDYKSLATGSAT